MRAGVMVNQSRPIDGIIAQARDAAEAGLSSVWMSQVFGYDALAVLALVGWEVPGIELGTGVIPIYPQHPLTLAESALTTQAATGGRLSLGLGLSHQPIVENFWGYSFDKPVRAMREYLAVLGPALAGEQVAYQGDTVKAMTMGPLGVRVDTPIPVLLAALGPAMLKLAGSQTDGTVTWMTGPATLADHIVPGLSAAASEAGRGAPRVVAALPICITDDESRVREQAASVFAIYGTLPSYRAMLDREGAGGPADVAIVGDEAAVRTELSRMADAGVTDFVAAPIGTEDEWRRTMDVLAAQA